MMRSALFCAGSWASLDVYGQLFVRACLGLGNIRPNLAPNTLSQPRQFRRICLGFGHCLMGFDQIWATSIGLGLVSFNFVPGSATFELVRSSFARFRPWFGRHAARFWANLVRDRPNLGAFERTCRGFGCSLGWFVQALAISTHAGRSSPKFSPCFTTFFRFRPKLARVRPSARCQENLSALVMCRHGNRQRF